jgi:Ca2+-transporting ATPase
VPWHCCSIDDAYAQLGSCAEGLADDAVAHLRTKFGANVVGDEASRSSWAMFASQFADLMVLILIVAAIVSGLIGDIADTVVIVAIVVLNALLGFLQEYRAERAMAALRAMAAPTAAVVRSGTARTVPAAELVPGDVVLLEAGRIVPADLRLVESAGLRIDESALTGESVPVDKQTAVVDAPDCPVAERTNVAFKGTVVTSGRGVGVTVATGGRTEFGRIAALLGEARAPRTPLQQRLTVFGRWLALIVILICSIVFVAGLLRGEPALPLLLLALSLAVAAIPEALPAVLTIALALGARKMIASRALVRRLRAVETLGSVTFICSDKTGTLTANQMRVDRYYCNGAYADRLDASDAARLLRLAMGVSHDVVVDASGRRVGDPTEVALVVAAAADGLDPARAIAEAPRVAEVPFDPQRKCMTTVHRVDGRYLSITKGAGEVVVAQSVREVRATATPIDRAAFARRVEQMAGDGLRVLGFGVRWFDAHPASPTADVLERDLDLVGLVGLLDPPRPGARDAIDVCIRAGIVPVMITGDHPSTARAIAQRLGLLERGGDVLTGPELDSIAPREFERRVRDVRVYARAAPEQKVKIVAALAAAGEVVAMTGDGVNDAPALKQADVGVAMGIAGTDVAKEAASIVLLDDDFATIVRAVREGRRIYDNLRHFVRYVLTTNSAEIWTIFLAPYLGLPIPLLPIQILWINLVSDGLPGLALTSERAEPDLMDRRPKPRNESLFARGLGAHAFVVGLIMAGLTLAVQAYFVELGRDTWQTAVFTTLCFAQLAHVMAIRSERASLLTLGFRTNLPLLGAVVLTVAMQLAVVYVPALNDVFKTVPLPPAELAATIAVAAVILLLVELEKGLRRRFDRDGAR